MKSYESIVHALNDLKIKGYVADFTTDNICLYCEEFDLRLDPDDFHVDEVFRVEGNSGYDDKAFVYAITAATGIRGTWVDASGADVQTHLTGLRV